MSEVDGVGDGGDADLLALLVKVRDEPGSLYRVSEAIYRHGGNVTYVSTISGGEIQFEMIGVDDRGQLIADLLALQPAVQGVSEVPSFQKIFGKRVIVIGGGAQVGQVAQGAVAEADRHNIRGERISVEVEGMRLGNTLFERMVYDAEAQPQTTTFVPKGWRVQLARDFWQRLARTFVVHCRCPRNHPQGADLAEIRGELLRHAVCEIFLLGIVREVYKRQHRE